MSETTDPESTHPGVAEWQMLCAIARDTVCAARVHGEASLSFRGYRVVARRLGAGSQTQVELRLHWEGAACPSSDTAVAFPDESTAALVIEPPAIVWTRRRGKFSAG